MANPDDFSSLRSKTLVYNNQLSDPKDEAMQELANVFSRPKVRPLRDPLYVPYHMPSSLLMPSHS